MSDSWEWRALQPTIISGNTIDTFNIELNRPKLAGLWNRLNSKRNNRLLFLDRALSLYKFEGSLLRYEWTKG